MPLDCTETYRGCTIITTQRGRWFTATVTGKVNRTVMRRFPSRSAAIDAACTMIEMVLDGGKPLVSTPDYAHDRRVKTPWEKHCDQLRKERSAQMEAK